ncbi:MAG: hypothetical protein SFV54_08675 [Bryobacteraceae bacterium]|nr:hypothetical protein [Bryobacteraceae bacterium]
MATIGAELVRSDTATRAVPGRLKWGDIVLKRGNMAPLSISMLKQVPSGEVVVVETKGGGDQSTVDELRKAISERSVYDLLAGDGRMSGQMQKVNVAAVKQVPMPAGFGVTIELRKL